MISVRIEPEITKRMEHLSRKSKLSKSQIVKKALQLYLHQVEKEETPFDLGADLFGLHSSNSGTRSVDVKNKIKEKISAKIPH